MKCFDTTTTLAELVTRYPECGRVLKEMKLDFCCQGEMSLSEACRKKSLDVDKVSDRIGQEIESRQGQLNQPNLERFATADLITYVVDTHHGYLRRVLPYLSALSQKVAAVHGQNESRLVALSTCFQELRETIEPHLDEEEQFLFPLLEQAEVDAIPMALQGMVEEHRGVGQLLAKLRDLSDDYQPPMWACRSYRTLYSELDALEMDVLRHIHIENHILAPRFQSLEIGCEVNRD